MKTRAITVTLTFIAGLYFILDFIVPPTLPLASARGVVVSTSPAAFTTQVRGARTSYRLDGPAATRPQILLAQRDMFGTLQMVPTPLRQIGVGSTVTVRIGPFTVLRSHAGPTPTVDTKEGPTIGLGPGSLWLDPASGRQITVPAAGSMLLIEQRDALIASIDRGSVVLLENSQRRTHALGHRTVLLKLGRYGPGAETQLAELRTGDTIEVGPATTFADNRDAASQFNLVLTTMAFGIGLLSLGYVNSVALLKRTPGWYVSLFFFGSLILGLIAGLGKYSDPGTSARTFSDFIVLRIIASVTSAVFSLLAFYMASAAYRAFRIRTAEAALMMVSALIVMLGQTPFGSYLTSWMGEKYSALWLPNVAAWILRVPNTAVFRGLIFGVMLGAIATALRYWLSMERSVTAGD